MEMYTVGGAVRDELLGVASKDTDFSVVLGQDDKFLLSGMDPFQVMVHNLTAQGFKIFLESPEFLTVRAQFPKTRSAVIGNPPSPLTITADFVLARKESDYTDGRRPDKVVPGTLMDDLARRDFTMNAIAKDSEGSLIDPFNGVEAIEQRIIRAVGDPMDRLMEDALRAVRALRFAVTKGFGIDRDLMDALATFDVAIALERISDERIQVELSKMFRFNTLESLRILGDFPVLTSSLFSGDVSLDATMKQRGRGR